MESAKEIKQKQKEKFFLEQFLKHQRITANNIEQLKPPNPDFIIDNEADKIGIEMTEVFIRHSPARGPHRSTETPVPQSVESSTDRICSLAQKFYLEANNTPVAAKIVFAPNITRDKEKGEQIAQHIAATVRHIGLQNSPATLWKPYDIETPLFHSITCIQIRKVPDRSFAQWSVVRAGLVHTLTVEDIQNRIDQKARKLNSYKKKIQNIWLLIVADRRRPSQYISVPSDFPVNAITSPFTKTFYYEYRDGGGEVIEF